MFVFCFSVLLFLHERKSKMPDRTRKRRTKAKSFEMFLKEKLRFSQGNIKNDYAKEGIRKKGAGVAFLQEAGVVL